MDHIKDSAIGLVAGINGGVATVYVGQPLDTVKVKMQTFPEVYNNAWKCFRVTWQKDGLSKGLYAGTVPALAANVAENAILFCALPPSQYLVGRFVGKEKGDRLSDFEHAIAGGMAAFWSSLALCPTELVKCKVQSMREMVELGLLKSSTDLGPWSVTKTIFREEGLRGFTRGLTPTFAREIPGYFFFFGGYEVSRTLFAGRHRDKHHLNPLETALCGGIGGCMLWTAIFPFDVIKSRMQIGHTEAVSQHVIHKTKPTLVELFLQIVRNEGIMPSINTKHPNLTRLIELLRIEQLNTKMKIEQLLSGQVVARDNKKYVQLKERLMKLVYNYDPNEDLSFSRACAHNFM